MLSEYFSASSPDHQLDAKQKLYGIVSYAGLAKERFIFWSR